MNASEPGSSVSSRFLQNWLVAICVCVGVLVLLASLAAPMLIPVVLGQTWWAFALMGLVYVGVISF